MTSIALGWLACSPAGPPDVAAKARAKEAELSAPVAYGPPADGRLRPTGGYLEGGTWWSVSATEPRQVGVDVATLRAVGTRTGPAGTRACVATGPEAFGTVCVGFRGGAWRVDRDEPVDGMPDRGGLTDVAWTGEALHVVDGIGEQLITLQAGRPVETRPLWPGVRRVLPVSDGRLVVLARQPPVVAVVEPTGAVRPLRSGTPVRDAVVDEARGLVWTVGPAPGPLRRHQGFLEGLYSTVEGTPLDGPPDRPRHVLDLRDKRLVDGVSLALVGDRLAVAASGSGAVWLVHPDTHHDVVVDAGLGPRGLVVAGERVLVPGRLDDRLVAIDVDATLREPVAAGRVRVTSVALGPTPEARHPAAIGELLFSQRALWSDDVRNDFTCESCHWEGLSDHRVHPGFLEQRRETTRPAVGMRGVAPVFSPMQSATLTEAVEGFVSTLDVRYWTRPERAPVLAPVVVSVPAAGGPLPITLSPASVREALVAWLMTAAPEPGPLRLPDGGLSAEARRGLHLFERDCAGCHEPVRNLRTRQLVSDVTEALRSGPLVFGAPLFQRSGIEPTMTPAGTRISPLVALYRGGPYFTDGSAPSLRAVVDRSDPTARRVHGASRRYYGPAERDALVAFLWSL